VIIIKIYQITDSQFKSLRENHLESMKFRDQSKAEGGNKQISRRENNIPPAWRW